MREKEWKLADASLYYETETGQGKESVRITRFQGPGSRVKVPELIGGLPVTVIDRKAFLSKKNLRRISLPDSVEEIGDWAFAYCDHLTEVILPHRAVRFGKAVFMECKELRRISVISAEGQLSDKPVAAFPGELLAAAVTAMDAAYLLDMEAAGTKEWLDKWDARLKNVLRTSDQEGFSKQILCGEEDYGSTDLNAYMSGRRKEKVRLIFLRLLSDQGLSPLLRRELEDYLRAHTKGENSDETWQVILREHGDDREYYQLFAAISCVTEGNLNDILADIGEEHQEMKAYFLRYREEVFGAADFFAGLEL
ncbi:MAG: leucine-rich repeat domain-containing protein [Acetatifactor sp.]|nr:leucine-rich repeat domain-containing protein [Acetatifactor sp.]